MSATVQPTDEDRLLRAFRKLVQSFFPQSIYWYVHEYTVIESDGATFSGLPTDTDFSPQLPVRVPYAPSLAGSQCVVPQGTLAHVVFINGDGNRPRCVGFDLPLPLRVQDLPTSTTVDASGSLKVGPSASVVVVGDPTTPQRFAREGDVYTLGLASGPLTFVSTTQLSGPTKGEG